MAESAAPANESLTTFDYGLYVVLILSWSASWYALALQVGSVAVPTSIFWRFLIAAALMWLWVAITKKPPHFAPRYHVAFAGMGLFIFCLNFMLFYYGSAYLISGLLSVVFSLASVVNLLFGAIFAKSMPRLRVLAGAALGVCGIALMFAPEIAGQSWQGTAAFGLALCVAGTLCFCTGSQISAALQRRKIPIIASSAWGMSYGALFAAIISLIGGNSLAIVWEPVYLSSLAFLAVVSSVIAFWSYLTLIGRIGAGRAGYATVVFPVLALVISAVMEGYAFPAIAVLGLACVLVGNVLVLGRGRDRHAVRVHPK